jgi:site-specific recombinase XerD
MKVTLREKKISKGQLSLYLDFYPPIIDDRSGSSTRREFLKLYLYEKPKTSIERDQNKETKLLAIKICAQRQIELQAGTYNFTSKAQRNSDFVEYFKNIVDIKKSSKGNHGNWLSTYNYLVKYTGGHLAFSLLTEKFCNGFRDFLLTSPAFASNDSTLSQNSASSYFSKFKNALTLAYKDGMLAQNLYSKVDFIKPGETKREFLTQEELQKLSETECEIPLLKQTAILSALTGLRFSDIKNLQWKNIQHSDAEGYSIRFKQQKTKGIEKLPISDQAHSFLGTQGEQDDLIFPNFIYSAWQNMKLQQWVYKARIQKAITFHCFRHTYATLQITNGTDIFTLSKLMGHREIKTTQIYAKVIDQKKVDAANRIKIDIK